MASVSTVVVPELSGLLKDPLKFDSLLGECFSYADSSAFGTILRTKALLSDIFGGDIPQECSAEDYVSAYERLSLIMTDTPDEIHAVFPGFMSLPENIAPEDFDDTQIERLASLCGDVTFSLECPADVKLLRRLSDRDNVGFDHVSVITERSESHDCAEIITALIDRGIPVTVCSKNAADRMKSVYGLDGSVFCVHDG